MSMKICNSMGACIAVAAMLVPISSAEELVCQGQWNGAWIDVLLKVDDRSGAIMGIVTDLGDRDRVAAAIMGRRLQDGSFRLDLSYRFEHFGTFLLKLSSQEAWMVWETEDKKLWFSPFGKVPPDRIPPEGDEDEGESKGVRESVWPVMLPNPLGPPVQALRGERLSGSDSRRESEAERDLRPGCCSLR